MTSHGVDCGRCPQIGDDCREQRPRTSDWADEGLVPNVVMVAHPPLLLDSGMLKHRHESITNNPKQTCGYKKFMFVVDPTQFDWGLKTDRVTCVPLSRIPECRAPSVYEGVVPGSVHRATTVKLRAFVPCVHFSLLHRLHAEPAPGFCADGALPQDHASHNQSLFSYFVCFYTHKQFDIDYVRTTAFVDQQSLGTKMLECRRGFLVRASRTHPVRPGARTAHNGFFPSFPFARGETQKKEEASNLAWDKQSSNGPYWSIEVSRNQPKWRASEVSLSG
ncbi:hypothetical protein EVAR_80700_1 [Eumeta japonica]|uniref:Uncharacterized protein n=1 Tax=Eumeta variegata TaxID=151549 RepID=A0A4C1U3K1_EUMVA|nr:hypothetical protein EVAR_80700_1 [Eumeta japonica]